MSKELELNFKRLRRNVIFFANGIFALFYIFGHLVFTDTSSASHIFLSGSAFYIFSYCVLFTGIIFIFNQFEILLNKTMV